MLTGGGGGRGLVLGSVLERGLLATSLGGHISCFTDKSEISQSMAAESKLFIFLLHPVTCWDIVQLVAEGETSSLKDRLRTLTAPLLRSWVDKVSHEYSIGLRMLHKLEV